MKLIRLLTVSFLCLTGIYVLLTLFIPPDPAGLVKYNITSTQSRLLSLTIAIPLVAIWLTALIALRRITRYSQKIQHEKDGKGFNYLSGGLAILVFGLPINSIAITIGNYAIRDNPYLKSLNVIANNYISVLILLLGFLLIYKGTDLLRAIKNSTSRDSSFNSIWRIIYVILSIGFIYVTLSNPNRTQPTSSVSEATYYLPDWLLVTTIILPYLYAWYIGLAAARQLSNYSNNVSGIIYRQAVKYIARGLIFVIIASIILRFLGRLNITFQNTELKVLLLIVYAVLLFIAAGYVYISIGAKKLKMIEDV